MTTELTIYEVSGQNWEVIDLVREFCWRFHLSCRSGLKIYYELLKDDMLKVKIIPVQELFSLEYLTASKVLYLDLEKTGKEFCGFKSRRASFRVEHENGNYRFIGEDYDGKCRCFESTPTFIPK